MQDISDAIGWPKENIRFSIRRLVRSGEVKARGVTGSRRFAAPALESPDNGAAPPKAPHRGRGRPPGSKDKTQRAVMPPRIDSRLIDDAIRALALHKDGYTQGLEVAIQMLKGLMPK